MKSFISIWVAVASLSTIGVFPQDNGNSCRDEIIRLYKQQLSDLQHEQTRYIRYLTRTVMRDSLRYRTSESEVELIARGRLVYCKSDLFEMFQDSTTTYFLLPGQKKLYIYDVDAEAAKKLNTGQFSLLQDSLLRQSDVLRCEKSPKSKDGTNKLVVLEFRKHMQKLMPVERLSFYLNDDKKLIRTFSAEYRKEHRVARSEYTVLDLRNNYRTDIFSKPHHSRFFGKANKLLPKYSNYSLIDLRKR